MTQQANVTINIAANNAASATLKAVQTDLSSVGRQAEGTGIAFSGASVHTGRLDTLMGKLSLSSNEGVGRMRGMTTAMAFMGLQAVGAQGPVARLGEGLLMFGGGHVAVLALAAVLVGVGFAMKAMGDGSDEAKKKLEELETQTHKTFEGSRPEVEKYAETVTRLQVGLKKAQDTHLKAALAVADYKNQLNDLTNSEDTQSGITLALAQAERTLAKSQDDVNKALHALGEARGVWFEKQKQQVDLYRMEADAVGKSADQVLRLRLEHEHFDPKLIDEAVHFERLKEAREAILAIDKYYLSLDPQTVGRTLGLPSDTDIDRANASIEEQKKIMEARKAAFAQFEKEQAARARGEGPDQTSNGATGEGASIAPPKPEVLSTVKKIAQGFLDAAGNAQTLSNVIGGALLQTVTAVGDGFISMFQAIFDGSQNAAKGFAIAMINAIKQVARLAGMEELAEAAKAIAHGIMGDPKAFAAAAKHAEAAALFFAVAGAAGAAAGGLSGGGSGGNGGLSPASVTSQSQQAKGSGTIIVQGGLLDVSDPRQADALAKALSDLSGRQIIITGRS